MTSQKNDKPRQISFWCDGKLAVQIRERAAAENTSIRAIIMRALLASGFVVPPADLDDKRK